MVDILIIVAVSATTTTPTETLTRSSIEGSAHTVLKGSLRVVRSLARAKE